MVGYYFIENGLGKRGFRRFRQEERRDDENWVKSTKMTAGGEAVVKGKKDLGRGDDW